MVKLTISISELSQYLGIGLSASYTLVHSQGFPVVKIGNRLLVPLSELEKWLSEQAYNISNTSED